MWQKSNKAMPEKTPHNCIYVCIYLYIECMYKPKSINSKSVHQRQKTAFLHSLKKNQKPTSQSHYSGALTAGTFYKQDHNRLK